MSSVTSFLFIEGIKWIYLRNKIPLENEMLIWTISLSLRRLKLKSSKMNWKPPINCVLHEKLSFVSYIICFLWFLRFNRKYFFAQTSRLENLGIVVYLHMSMRNKKIFFYIVILCTARIWLQRYWMNDKLYIFFQ